MVAGRIDPNDPLYIGPSDASSAVLIPIKLTGPENYGVWSRSMRIALTGKRKIGFITGACSRSLYRDELHEQWETCNAIVLSWLMNSVSEDLLNGIVYATSAYVVWQDLKERFDKVNRMRIYQLYREINTISQGTDSVSSYYTKLKNLWGKFDALMPSPSCACPKSKEYADHLYQLRLIQFLSGLNESYEQAKRQILLKGVTPTIN
ncbi:uncharacterized protein [Solanum lycopersicum]|uniref:uncharacterized protein n=1 Tax=Solanum lycopersicum TaxID=4081 RepID=UPI00374A8F2D